MKKVRQAEVVVFLALLAPMGAFSASQKCSVETYLEQLHNQLPPNKAKVIVTFEGDIQHDIVEKYGEVLKTLKIINGVVAVINRDDISILQNEEGIKNVAIDTRISIIPPPPRQSIEYSATAFETLDSNEVLVGWNLQEPGIAASDTPPPPNEPNSIGAWNTYSVDGSGVIIAILDTGVNYTLEDLNAPNYLGGYDFYNDDDDPMDDNWNPDNGWYGHGTLVTTVAIAQGDEQIKGVAPNVSYYALKVLDSYGTTDMSDVIEALDWCVNVADPKPDIVNMSLGIYGPNPFYPPATKAAFEAACTAAYNAGIILVAASGNDGYSYSADPASFANVISVGGHREDQDLYANSNAGVDFVAPGKSVPSMDMTGDASWLYKGTSFAAPHVAGIAAISLQYARQNDIEISKGYFFELVKHSASDMPLIPDPVYKGKGKARALESIDLIASNWPIDYDITFSEYASFPDSNYPAYHIGEDVNQTIILTNITDILGNTIETIEDITVTIKQLYYNSPNEPNLPGDFIEVFPAISNFYPGESNSIDLSLLYTIPSDTVPGLVQTKLELEFNFLGNSRIIKVSYYQPNLLWYAAIPGDLNLDNNVNMTDFSIFSRRWQNHGCIDPDYCNRADINRSSYVDWSDVSVLAMNWLRN